MKTLLKKALLFLGLSVIYLIGCGSSSSGASPTPISVNTNLPSNSQTDCLS